MATKTRGFFVCFQTFLPPHKIYVLYLKKVA
jgi:hypothetical protein